MQTISTGSTYRSPFVVLAVLIVAAAVGSVALALQPAYKGVGDVPASVVGAGATLDWQRVGRLLASVDVGTPSPTLRILRGQAEMAANQSNAAALLFDTVSDPSQLAGWLLWTSRLSSAYPNSPGAAYLKGDALARLGRYDDAAASFTRALKLRPADAMILNARGVTYASMRNWNLALIDFDAASKADPRFAQPLINRGMTYIAMKSGSKGALSSFNEALRLDRQAASAFLGRGCIEYVERNPALAQRDFAVARSLSPVVARWARLDEAGYVRACGGDRNVALASSRELGTTIERGIAAVKANPWDQSAANKLINAMTLAKETGDPAYAKGMNGIQEMTHDPRVAAGFGYSVKAVQDWNRPGGFAHIFGQVLSGAGLSFGAKGFGVSESGGAFGQGMQDRTKGNFDTASVVSRGINGKSDSYYGGVDFALSNAQLEDGHWPFVAAFGNGYTRVP